MQKIIKTFLIIDKMEFVQKLNNRIALGKSILSQEISTEEAFIKFKNEKTKWFEYNKELLKQSFNTPENEYLKEYERSHFIAGVIGGSNPLPLKIEKVKKEISDYIKGLEILLNKLDLIPTQAY